MANAAAICDRFAGIFLQYSEPASVIREVMGSPENRYQLSSRIRRQSFAIQDRSLSASMP
jgi:hypothetical protein